MPDEFDVMTGMASLDAVDADGISVCCVARLAPVEIVHGEGCVAGYLVQALPVGHRLLHGILVVEYFVASDDGLYTAGQAQPTKTVVEDLVEL